MLHSYFWFIFNPVNCSFKTWFKFFKQFWIILSWQSYNWNIKFCSSYLNVGSWPAIGLSIIKHLLGQVRIRLISQLINGIVRVLQKLLKYFNHTLILTFFVPSFSVLPIFVLNLNEALLLLSVGKSAITPLAKNGSFS